MLQKAREEKNARFQPIPAEEGFIFTCLREDREQGYVIRNLPDQDCVHNVKKLEMSSFTLRPV